MTRFRSFSFCLALSVLTSCSSTGDTSGTTSSSGTSTTGDDASAPSGTGTSDSAGGDGAADGASGGGSDDASSQADGAVADDTGSTTAPCTSPMDCPGTTACIDGVCGACQKDSDCGDIPLCFPLTGACMGCTKDSHCVDPSKPYCLNKGCTACRTDADCPDPALPGCQVWDYVMACRVCSKDEHCADPAKPHCGSRVPVGGSSNALGCWECTKDEHCLARGDQKIQCSPSGTCVSKQCMNSDDAQCPDGYACQNICVPKCKTNDDCKNSWWSEDGGTFGPVCNTTVGKCRECVANTDCTDPKKPTCSPTKGWCAYQCAASADCTDPSKPNCAFSPGIDGECIP